MMRGAPQLALKTEEGATSRGTEVSLEAGEGKEMDSLLEPAEGNTARPRPSF